MNNTISSVCRKGTGYKSGLCVFFSCENEQKASLFMENQLYRKPGRSNSSGGPRSIT